MEKANPTCRYGHGAMPRVFEKRLHGHQPDGPQTFLIRENAENWYGLFPARIPVYAFQCCVCSYMELHRAE